MKVLFLNTPYKFKISRDSRWPEYTKSGTLYYPYWLSYAAGVMLEHSNHEVELWDAIAEGWSYEHTLNKILNYNPDLIVMNSNTPTIFEDAAFAQRIKEKLDDVRIVFVGTHVSALPQETLQRFSSIDIVARGEYDYTILDIANALEKKKGLSKVKGISYRKNRKIFHTPERPLIKNLDILPFVSKVYMRFLDIRKYRYALARHPMMQIWSSRGCPNRCVFCQYPQVFSSHLFRTRSPENFVMELEWIKENAPFVKEIFVEDDTMSVDKKRILKIAKLIQEKRLDITWSFNGRADIPYEVLKELKKAGCRMIIVGYESGNQNVLNNAKKGITLTQAKKFTLNAKKVGIKIFGCFMIGLPGETKETVYETLKFAQKINPHMAFFQQAVPFPGTEFFHWLKGEGYMLDKSWDEWLEKDGRLGFLFEYPQLSKVEMRKLREEITLRFYLNPKWIAQFFLTELHPEELKRNINAMFNYLKFLFWER